MIKELAICSYVLIIHTPRLCGIPGFRNLEKEVESAGIRCRRVVGDDELDEWVEKGKRENERLRTKKTELLGVTDGLAEFEKTGFEGIEEGRTHVQILEGIGQGDLKAVLEQAMAALGKPRRNVAGETESEEDDQGDSQGREEGAEEVFVVSWEDGEDGAVLLNADVLGGGDQEGGQLNGDEKEAILRVVREFLEGRGDAANVEIVNLNDVEDQPQYHDEL